MNNARNIFGAVCVLVVAVYMVAAQSGPLESWSLHAADSYYNLLVQGFHSGQLALKKDVPPGFAQLADPYEPAANALYRPAANAMMDMSYYKGKLYLYFGVTPALILFWPFAALTGHYLFHRQAVAIFSAVGFLASAALLRALWRRYFAEVSIGPVVGCVLALGLATGVPVMLPQSDVYEVPISCGYMLTMLALGAIWCGLQASEARKRWAWSAAASVAYGLAIGARPSLMFGAVILLAPVFHAWHQRRPMGLLMMAATGPILVIGLGLMLYNALRFENPFEFGWHYQLGPVRQVTAHPFNPQYLWFNFRVYFLEPARWNGRFPFVHDIILPPLLPGHHGHAGQTPFGALSNIPLVWLAPLGAALAWRGQPSEARSILQGFLTAVAALCVVCAVTISLFLVSAMRYEVEFLPFMVLLAAVGILGLERATAQRPAWRRVVRWGAGTLVSFSAAFNLLAGVVNYAEAQGFKGNALLRAGRIQEAISLYEMALRIRPEFADAHKNLGIALAQAGQMEDAIGHYQQALRIRPDDSDAHLNLGLALQRLGSTQKAIFHLQQALRFRPDSPEAHNNLGVALERQGNLGEAIGHFEEALRLRPEYAEAQFNLGHALLPQGRVQDAVGHYVEAVRIKPDYVEAWTALGAGLAQSGRLDEAIGDWERAIRINPDFADAHYNLGVALEQLGRVPEAIQHYEQVLRIRPNDSGVRETLARLRAAP